MDIDDIIWMGPQPSVASKGQPIMPNSKLAKANRPDLDNLTGDFPHTAWRAQIEHAKKIGLGEDSYELVTI